MANSRNTNMRQSRVRYRKCKKCGVEGTPDSPISSRGKCSLCGIRALQMNIVQQKRKLGPYYENWIVGMIGALEKSTGGDVVLSFSEDVTESDYSEAPDLRMLG